MNADGLHTFMLSIKEDNFNNSRYYLNAFQMYFNIFEETMDTMSDIHSLMRDNVFKNIK